MRRLSLVRFCPGLMAMLALLLVLTGPAAAACHAVVQPGQCGSPGSG